MGRFLGNGRIDERRGERCATERGCEGLREGRRERCHGNEMGARE
jgi:hypothetical protein